jgi:membrane protein YqaA with SNARE-associated domain
MAMVGMLLLTWGAVFLVNLVPAFMPPTWSILAFFLIRFDLPLLPLALGGAVAATLGRLALALGARRLGPKILPADTLQNLTDLGRFLQTRRRWVGPAVLLYSFGPIPSNQLFMAAGLANLDLRVVAGAFFLGRVVSYTFFSHVADKAVDSLTDVFADSLTSPQMLLLELASLAILVAIAKIPWGKLLGVQSPAAPPGATPRAERAG